MNDAYRALIESDRVSRRTRAALLARAAPDDPAYQPQTMDAAVYATFRALLARILPQDRVDLAQRLDRAYAAADGDGWRFAALAPDPAACRAALAALDAAGFTTCDPAAQDAMLHAVQSGAHGREAQLWFEDLRGTAAKLYVAHPSTLARIGYSGIAYGGDGPDKPGFTQLEPGQREPWEPLPQHGAP